MIIGLKRHTVRLVEHQPEWTSLFGAEAKALHDRIGELVVDIQHIGSTAVPGLPAKPILDVAVALRSCDAIPKIVSRLVEGGYIDRGDGGSDGGYLLVKEPEPDVRSVHLHLVEEKDPQWRDYIAFRNTVAEDSGVRGRYARLKRKLAREYADDRKSYTAEKDHFIEEILSR